MRYQVPGVPAGAQPSAYLPNLTRPAGSGAQAYKAAVSGQPGTQAIAAPTTDLPGKGSRVAQAEMGGARSELAPDAWYPQVYYQRCLTNAAPVNIYSDNILPVPAVDGRGIPARLARPIVQRGKYQIGQPRVVPTWGPGG